MAVLAGAGAMAFSGTASAALTHTPLSLTFSAGAGCAKVGDVAVVESTGLVYVTCTGGSPIPTQIRRFDLSGNPVNFTASAPYIQGNAIIGDPGDKAQGLFASGGVVIDVDNSAANNGYLFVSTYSAGEAACHCLSIFDSTGAWVTSLQPTDEAPAYGSNGVAVGDDGSLYWSVSQSATPYSHVSKIGPDLRETRRMLLPANNARLRADSTGAAWVLGPPNKLGLRKFEADQFTTQLKTTSADIEGLGLSYATPSPFASDPALPTSGTVGSFSYSFDVDPTSDDLYVNRNGLVTPYSAGDATEPVHQNGPAFGSGLVSTASDSGIAVTGDGRVYVAAKSGGVAVFPPGAVVPDVRTPAPELDDIGHTSVAVHAQLERAGGPVITSCVVQYGIDTDYTAAPVPCSADAGSSFSDPTVPVTATLPGLSTGTPYHYRFKAGNANGTNTGLDRDITPAAVLSLRTLAADDVEEHSATLNGSFEPDNLQTTYRFEYGLDGGYGQSTAPTVVAPTTASQSVAVPVANLPAGRTFHYRIVATNILGTTHGRDLTFRSASAPRISGVRATDVTANSALLNARIDPVGYDTSYYFEYGTTSAYGSEIPLSPGDDLAVTDSPQNVSQEISDLTPGVTYHFRVVATNEWGEGASEDTTVDFLPPSCPNADVRQQTRTSYLPDCRAYELVSPSNAGSVTLFPSEEIPLFTAVYTIPPLWSVNNGMATNPARFSYFGGIGTVMGLDAPNGAFDMYSATRTSTGWVTSLPGLSGHQAVFVASKHCSDSLDLCIDHNAGDVLKGTTPGESAPHLFRADGTPLGQLPTNAGVIPGGRHFTGDQRPSPDLSHFAFSSTDVRFAPGGIKGPPGSAYDNDIEAHTVDVISELPNGDPIPQELDPVDNPDEHIEFPAISRDGSHVLMQVRSSDGGVSVSDGRVHLYMRVGDSVTYDVSRGHGVTFAGMTDDGGKVYFLARQRLLANDNDNSADLYLWQEAAGADTLTRVSLGNGEGDTDSCNPSWGSKCNVATLSTEKGNPFGIVSAPGSDDRLAGDSGDIYFYSPELLDPSNPGIPNQRNLYLYRAGGVRLVATLDPGTAINRVQISPDGARAAFLTESRLTGYDNRGFREMYTYGADAGAITCASCRPDGLPPTGDVLASQGGPFMADDGRAFFTTPDSLTPQDSNGNVLDVYEYVGGRPQLISAGTGSRDFTGGNTLLSIFPGVHTGLESVSADGRDVYFSTFDTLVPEDHNGPFVKFYVARTGGGFTQLADLAPCEAADECHAPTPARPTLPSIATGAALGSGGNATPSSTAKRKAKSKKKKAKRHNRAKDKRGHGGGRRHG